MKTKHKQRIAIIGAGFSGLGMAYQLLKRGHEDIVIYERASSLGGTWRDNQYPGAACDVPSYLYSYSFAQNPDWSRMFAQSEEIRQYLERCADDFGVRKFIRWNTTITKAAYDDGKWTLFDEQGVLKTVDVVISAIGGLSNPKWPDIPGLSTFDGEAMHTAQWNHEHDLTDKRVAVIGTGASAIQVIPSIVDRVKHLKIVQRTPPWVIPRPDRPVRSFERWLFRYVPGTQWLARSIVYWIEEILAMALIWEGRAARRFQALGTRHLNDSIADPELRERLRPDYRIGCKRVLISNDYYPCFERDHVDLLDQGIEAITPEGVLMRDGSKHDVDTIIMATGFDVPTDHFPIQVVGRGGLTLQEAWRDGAEAYRGIMVHQFPNLFFLMGPNTAPGHTSVMVYVEAQIGYICKALASMTAHNVRALEVRESVQRAFNKTLQKRMDGTVWTSGCQSWYLTESGKNTTLWPGFSWRYCVETASFRLSEMQTL